MKKFTLVAVSVLAAAATISAICCHGAHKCNKAIDDLRD